MIEMTGMTEFMDHQVFHRIRRQEQQLIIEADITATGATSPTCFLAANAQPIVGQPGLPGYTLE